MRVYRVIWSEDGPHIEAGEIVYRGTKKTRPMIKFPSLPKLVEYSHGKPTIREAIEVSILYQAEIFSRKEKPWILASAIVELMRLYRRLQKHHLVPQRRSK